MNINLTVLLENASPQFIPSLTSTSLEDGALRQRREATLPPSEAVRGASCGEC